MTAPLSTRRAPPMRRSDTPDVVRRVKSLLGGHPDLLDGFNCFLPEVRALPFARHATPRRRLSPPTGWGTASDTSRGGVRARVSATLSVAFSRSIFERRASMGSRQRPRGSSRVRPRATAPRPRVLSPISHPSVLTRSPYPPHLQPYKFSTATDDKEASQVSPSTRPVLPPRTSGRSDRPETRFSPRASFAASRAAPASVSRASRRATAPAGSLSFALGCRFQPSAERWVPRAPRRAARLPWTPRLTLPRK